MAHEISSELLSKMMVERAYQATKNTDRIQKYLDFHLHRSPRSFDEVLKDVCGVMNDGKKHYEDCSGSDDKDERYYEHTSRIVFSQPTTDDCGGTLMGCATTFIFILVLHSHPLQKELRLVNECLRPQCRKTQQALPKGRLTQKMIRDVLTPMYKEAMEHVKRENENVMIRLKEWLLEGAYYEHYYNPMRELGVPRYEILSEERVRRLLEQRDEDD